MKPIIIDIGSYALKMGFGGEFAPRFDIPLCVGKIREDLDFITRKHIYQELNLNVDPKQEYFFGHEAWYLRNLLDISWISNGRSIVDEYFFNKVFDYAIDLLQVRFTTQPVLITQPFYSDIVNHVGEILYTTYNAYEIVPAFQPLLDYLAGGLKTGLVVNIGHSITQITPMINGTIVTDGVMVVDMGGRDVTDILLEFLLEKNAFDGLKESYILSKEAIADTFKVLYCYVSRDPAVELDAEQDQISFPLFGNDTLNVGVERFLAPEFLFVPQKKGLKALDDLIYEIVTKYDPPYQQAFLGNILLTGGTSLLPGLAERLHEELIRKFIEYDYKINVNAFSQFGSPRYSTYFGAAKLTATDIDESLTFSKTNYKRKRAIEIPVVFMEQFSSIFDQTAATKLKPIVISVENFYNRYLLQQIYNILNSQREVSMTGLAHYLRRSPVELYEIIETLINYEIIEGEFRGRVFINTQFREEEEAVPAYTEMPKPEPEPEPTMQQATIEEKEYVPSFQRLDEQMPDQIPAESQKIMDQEGYVPSFQRLDTQMPDQMQPTAQRQEIEEEGYVPSFQRLDVQMPDQMEVKTPKYSGEPEAVDEIEKTQYEYTFQKIDDQMEDKWAKDQTILSGKESSGPKTKVLVEEGLSFERVDAEKAAEWEKEGLISTPKPVEPRGFFDQIAIPVEPSEEDLTYTKVDEEKAVEWAADETIVTGKVKSAREELKVLLRGGPSYMKAEEEKGEEWEESGLISVPKRPMPKGFFSQSSLETTEEELPTFLKISDQEVLKPKKVMIADLLQPKAAGPRPTTQTKSKIPTFLEGKELTEEQLRQLKEFEEEERKKKEKEEKLL